MFAVLLKARAADKVATFARACLRTRMLHAMERTIGVHMVCVLHWLRSRQQVECPPLTIERIQRNEEMGRTAKSAFVVL